MRFLAICLGVLCLPLFVTAAPVPKERADAEKVVGTWKLVKSTHEQPGQKIALELELTQGGKMIIRQSVNGGPVATYEGEYKVVKDELPYTMKFPGGTEKKETLKIKRLTETELVVVDPDNIQEDFERIKKKEDPKPEEKK